MAVETLDPIVVGFIERERLNGALTALHRGGFGHLTRVFDPERGDLPGQLRRAGITLETSPPTIGAARVAVGVAAAKRHREAQGLLLAHGATLCETCDRSVDAGTAAINAMSSSTPVGTRRRPMQSPFQTAD